jgi:hypothetical protein
MATRICPGGHLLFVRASKTSAGSETHSARQAPKVTAIGTILGTFLFLSNENRSTIKMATTYPAKISTSLSVSYHCSA